MCPRLKNWIWQDYYTSKKAIKHMREKGSEIRVGLLVIVSFFILFFAILWGKEFSFGKRQQTLQILFPSSAGLEVSDPVTIAGIKMGKVTGIQLSEGKALVSCALSDKVIIFSDARARIQSAELMGTEMVSLDPGGNGIVLRGNERLEPIIGAPSLTTGDMIAQFGNLAEQTKCVIARLDTMLADISHSLVNAEVTRSVRISIANLEASSAQLRSLLEDEQQNVRATLANVQEASTAVTTLLSNHQQQLDSSLVNFARASHEVHEFSVSINEMMSQLREGRGTAGKLLSDDELYARLLALTQNLESLSKDLKKNLGRYLSGADINLINLFE